MRIGFIGQGQMGRPMSLRLADVGYEIVAFDLDPGSVARGEHLRHRAVRAVLDLAGLSVVVTMLPDGDAVREALLDSGLAPRLATGCTVVDTTSADPAASLATAATLDDQGVRFVDAPVSGSPQGARRGELTVMLGGGSLVDDQVRRVIGSLGRIHDVGPVGTGHAAKALNNLLASANLAAATEVLLVGQRYGIDPGVLLAVLNASSGRNTATEDKLEQFALSRTFDSGFRLALMRKDIRNAVELARSVDGPDGVAQLCLGIWTDALEAYGPTADNVEVVRWLEAVAGAELNSSA